MNWDAIGAVGEIVGAAAVVATLAYLASQIRVQIKEARVASVHELLEGFRDIMVSLEDPARAEVWVQGILGLEKLSGAQRLQFFALFQHVMRLLEEAYYQYEEERFDSRVWTGFATQMEDIMATKGFQDVWALRRHTYSKDFRELVDSLEGGDYRLSSETEQMIASAE